jgi:ATP-dependent DNA helicase UvrD/PcrA
MDDDPQFKSPEVTNEDISWVTRLLKLPDDAFFGKDRMDPRQEVLRSMTHIDVAACPGSGKTTLLVAKLAILAEKWRYRTRGICVLSHTNVARNEIESRLGNTTTGRRLLSYPHYIGTIHGFVNEFLAIPWLRSQGYPIKMIDTDICLKRRWHALPIATQTGLEKNHYGPSVLAIKSSDFSVGKVRWGKGYLGIDTSTYKIIRDTCRQSTTEGYLCYDEMFTWARDLMDHVTGVTEVVRDRFPLLFIDEGQDNSEEQSTILHRIFIDGNGAVIRQRFGDGNQAIFDSMGAKEATTDKFPDSTVKKELPNSHRFGQKIADLADPLGLVPYVLKGQGPQTSLASGVSEGQHTIFLLAEDRASRVLDAYAELLLKTFSAQELREGTFVAVGQIHRPPDQKEPHKIPRHIGDYWPDYDPELTRPDPKPQTFVQYVFAGMTRAKASGEAYPSVEKIAEGILRLARIIEGTKDFPHRRHNHQYVLELLEGSTDIRGSYEDLIVRFAVKREAPTKETWNDHWCVVVRKIAETIADLPTSSPGINGFLDWKDEPGGPKTLHGVPRSRDNIYRYPHDDPKVHIHVGSIHSVKGQTHTATLILETFWQKHNLDSLAPWLDGSNSGGQSDGVQQQVRLKLHYVAMTRPAHLLCLAMKRNTFEDPNGDLDPEVLEKLNQQGWQVRLI